MVLYTGERKLKDLLVFLDEEMEKAKKYRVVVSHTSHRCTAAGFELYCVCFLLMIKIKFFPSCIPGGRRKKEVHGCTER